MQTLLRTPLLSLLALVFLAAAPRARAQVSIIANNSVAASDISRADLHDIFTGASSGLKGSGQVVPVLLRDGAVHEAFLSRYIDRSDTAFRAAWRSLLFSGQSTMPHTFSSDAEVVDYVTHTPGAIGYIASASPHPGVKILAVR